MSAHWIIFLIAIPIGIFIKWLIDKSADFSGLIAKELKKEGLAAGNQRRRPHSPATASGCR